jgi:hypothetical protein
MKAGGSYRIYPAIAGQLNSFTHLRALLVLRDSIIIMNMLMPVNRMVSHILEPSSWYSTIPVALSNIIFVLDKTEITLVYKFIYSPANIYLLVNNNIYSPAIDLTSASARKVWTA